MDDYNNKLLDLIAGKQKILEMVIILCVFIAIGFSFGRNGSRWFWSGLPFIAFILVIIGLLLALLWIRIERNKNQDLINKISKAFKTNSGTYKEKINLLTSRQRVILNLIINGKSNKEIINELFIELSTLKTHINKIYKTLGISSRREARSFGNPDKS